MLAGPDRSTDIRTIGRQLGYLSVTLVFMGGLSLMLWDRMRNPNAQPGRTRIGDVVMALPTFDQRCGENDHVRVDMIHSEDKAAWLVDGTARFMEACPNVQVRLHAMADREAIATIESGALVPALWAPTDSIFVDHLEERRPSHAPALTRGPSLLRSPVVVLLWEDRLAALDVLLPNMAERASAWAELACAGVSDVADSPSAEVETERPIPWAEWWNARFPVPERLPAEPTIEALERWSGVEVLHAAPSRSSDGALALMLLAHAHAAAETGPEAVASRDDFEDALELRQEALESWLRRCEGHRDTLLDTAEILTERMFQLDALGLDGAITPEYLALEILARAGKHEELNRARVVYPRSTLVVDHPVAYFAMEDEQTRDGAQRLVEFLRDDEMQRVAISLGFRPGNSQVTIHDGDIHPNPFLELRRFGTMPDLDVVEVPRLSREHLRTLVETWEDVTGLH